MEASLLEFTQLYLLGLATGIAVGSLIWFKWLLENKKLVWSGN